MTSINTNQSAMVAMQTLRGINNNLSTLNDQISTGKTINTAKDNASIWSISKTMESDVMSFSTVTDSLALADSTVGVARTAAESITDLLTEVKSLITESSNKNSDDRSIIAEDISNLTNQIMDIVDAAQFNGVNLLNDTTAVDYLSSFNRSADGTVVTDTITVERQDLRVGTITAGDFATGSAVTGVSVTSTTIDASGGAQADQTVFSLSSTATINEGDNFRVTLGGTNYDYEAAAGDDAAAVMSALATLVDDASISNVSNVEVTGSGTLALELDLASGSLVVAGDSAQRTVADSGSLSALLDIDISNEVGTTAALTSIETLMGVAQDAAAAFGSSQTRIEIQSEFVTNLTDTLELGISTLTDADLEAASAELQALQVQQQLALSSLSIANQTPQTILSLFQ